MFILAGGRDEDPVTAFQKYRDYLESVRDHFPPNAFELATSEWWFNFNDHNCPHDSWLETAILSEPSSGERHEVRFTELQLLLLGAYHDVKLRLTYNGVATLELDSFGLTKGHGDWRYDEFRVSDDGLLIHEIEWQNYKTQSRWLITAQDIEYDTEPFETAA